MYRARTIRRDSRWTEDRAVTAERLELQQRPLQQRLSQQVRRLSPTATAPRLAGLSRFCPDHFFNLSVAVVSWRHPRSLLIHSLDRPGILRRWL